MLSPMPIAITHGRRLESDPLHDAGGREHQRPGHHAGHEAQGQARSEVVEGHEVRGAVRLFDAQLPAALLRRRARHRSRQDVQIRAVPPPEMVANLRADNIDGFLGARSDEPARGVRRRRLHPHPVEGYLGPASLLRVRGLEGVRHRFAEHLCGAAQGDHRRDRVCDQAGEPQADRRSDRAGELPQPAGDGGGAGADRHLRRRSRQREDRCRTASISIRSRGSPSRSGS